MHSKKFNYLILFFFVLGFMSMYGCPDTVGINLDTQEKKCDAAAAEFNILVEEYLKIQDSVDDETHKKVKAAIKAADIALDTWEAMIGNPNYDFSKDVKTWIAAKNLIIETIKEFK